MKVEILRRRIGEEKSYWESFSYEPASEQETVISLLDHLNAREDLRNSQGEPSLPIRFEKSCLQKKCGACAMIVNGAPVLACQAKLFTGKKKKKPLELIRLEPLRKFPVVEDLIVNREVLFQNLREIGAWLEGEGLSEEVSRKKLQQDNEARYEASRCLQCGICLEVCPNWSVDTAFAGMAAAIPLSRLLYAEGKTAERKRLSREYRERVYEGCGKSLACQQVCPAEIPIDFLIARSAGIAVWSGLLSKNINIFPMGFR
ncbi:MAG: 4Fe-4S dicluster domain-containing protein [Lachnospiraceae bacterium]|nr:4Fe-4S dicluster domain-containing protein [Lachnospiraceae bacterium]